MVRLTFLIPVLLSIAAFICSLLVLIAGKDTSTLNHIYLLRVDTSHIRPSGLDLDVNSIADILGIDIPDGLNIDLPDYLIDKVTQTAAKKLGLRDYYTSHVMNYCEGVITDADDEDPNTNKTHTTYCSPVNGVYAFDPTDIFERELFPGITLENIGITKDVETAIEALALAYKAMFITLAIGVALSGVSVVLALIIGWKESRGVALALGITSIIAMLALLIATAIATVMATKLKDVLNEKLGEKVNIWASNDGGYLMGMAWAATACMVLVTLYWCVGCCCSGGRHRQSRREKKQMMREV